MFLLLLLLLIKKYAIKNDVDNLYVYFDLIKNENYLLLFLCLSTSSNMPILVSAAVGSALPQPL